MVHDQELRVVLPAGTGTTALFLARHLVPEGIPVYAVPCAGDTAYLYRQMAKVGKGRKWESLQWVAVAVEGREGTACFGEMPGGKTCAAVGGCGRGAAVRCSVGTTGGWLTGYLC